MCHIISSRQITYVVRVCTKYSHLGTCFALYCILVWKNYAFEEHKVPHSSVDCFHTYSYAHHTFTEESGTIINVFSVLLRWEGKLDGSNNSGNECFIL